MHYSSLLEPVQREYLQYLNSLKSKMDHHHQDNQQRKFMFRCADGVLLDGSQAPLGRAVFRSCAGRDQVRSVLLYRVLLYIDIDLLYRWGCAGCWADTSWLTIM